MEKIRKDTRRRRKLYRRFRKGKKRRKQERRVTGRENSDRKVEKEGKVRGDG